MRTTLLVSLATALLTAPSVVYAAPELYYNASTGNLWINNDVPLSIVNIMSPTGALNAPTFPAGPIPAPVVLDKGDLPFFLVTINTPVGFFNLGSGTVDPGTPPSLLSFDWHPAFGQPAVSGVVKLPEPSTALMASLAMVGVVNLRRRRSKSEIHRG